jgi:hypothetical protein
MSRYASLWDRLCAHCREDGGCWTWTGPLRRHGGGERPALSMRVPGVQNPRNFNAARLMCELFHGPAPTPEHEASHLCLDNWLCIHPWHVVWETKKENIARRNNRYWDMAGDPRFDPDLFDGMHCADREAPF